MIAKPTNIVKWVNDKKKYFHPPVCNKLFSNQQLKVFFVGGPNQRLDYHVNSGEELFFMIKGSMQLNVIEKEKKSEIEIREGEIFLLPPRVPHSPQRHAETVGLVIERKRRDDELDCLRWFIPETTEILWERWLHCVDLGAQLVPIIKEFNSSIEKKTGKPSLSSRLIEPPYMDNYRAKLDKPFSVNHWLERQRIEGENFKSLFQNSHSKIGFYWPGKFSINDRCEHFLWQWRYSSKIEWIEGETQLTVNHCVILKCGENFHVENRGLIFYVSMTSNE